ncbi:hypothetical protein [Polyangium sp. y55x31]|uniref:hypothetical protein n=1 Tax=Polyangium sp. y55x31 TaxID=3042688 RepID=UPI0024826189|nr:hypothetical protein [Polyangium sp. y55x31]MDI1480265.1 hypothetical protein [Polyangium sp. y55x31]
MEGCLDIFRNARDAIREAGARSALADVWHELGDSAQAIQQAWMALDVRNTHSDPQDRSGSHHNLSIYLQKTGRGTEAAKHWLAGFAYDLATGVDLQGSLQALPFHRQVATTRSEIFTVPPLASLLQDPEFSPLRQFLADRGEDIEALDVEIRAAIETASGPRTSDHS